MSDQTGPSTNQLHLTYAQIMSRLAEKLSACPKRWGPCRAFMHACRSANLDAGEAAESLAMLRIIKIGPHDLAVCPNDLAVVDADNF